VGNYGFVYVEDYLPELRKFDAKEYPSSLSEINFGDTVGGKLIDEKQKGFASRLRFDPRPVTMSFRDENYSYALNAVLLAAGWQGRLQGRMIMAGPSVLGKSFGNQVSKIYRLNQVGANAAADYLANLGASVTKTNTITTSVTQGVAQGEAVSSAANSQTTQSSTITNVEAYGASSGPLLGLRATTDTRLGTITLVGDPSTISIAEQYLKKLDLRQRQVALSVRILDVNLDNVSEIELIRTTLG